MKRDCDPTGQGNSDDPMFTTAENMANAIASVGLFLLCFSLLM